MKQHIQVKIPKMPMIEYAYAVCDGCGAEDAPTYGSPSCAVPREWHQTTEQQPDGLVLSRCYCPACSCPPVAPSAIDLDMPRVSPHPSDTFSECDGRKAAHALPSVRFSEADAQRLGFRKEIVRDRETGDFLMLLDNEPIGFARSYSDADITLDELIFAIRYQDTPGTFCPSCGDELHEDAAVCAACREGGEGPCSN